MSATEAITRERVDQIMEDSIRLHRQLVFTNHGPRGWRAYKSKFISGSSSSSILKISTPLRSQQIEQPSTQTEQMLPGIGETVGVTFRLGHKKCMFATAIHATERHANNALLSLGWPEHLQRLQRRAYARVEPPRGTVVAVRFWRESDGISASTETRDVRHGQIEDLSAGGMRIKARDPDDIEVGCTYRCSFALRAGKPTFLLHALLRHHEAVDHGRASLGFQFVGLEASADGLQTLGRLAGVVSQFQRSRQHARRSHT